MPVAVILGNPGGADTVVRVKESSD